MTITSDKKWRVVDTKEYSPYINVCLKAIEDESVFNNFRRINDYRTVLEHVSYQLGYEYFTFIQSKFPHLLEEKNIIKFFSQDLDKIGNPETFLYSINNKEYYISPTTLRYLKVLGDLEKCFGDLSGLNIVEIGGGYGGQCKLILDYFKIKSYNIQDDVNVIPLIKKYLKLFNYSITDNKNKVDLVISNYAYSELNCELQQEYFDKFLSKTKFLYLTGVREDFCIDILKPLKDQILCLEEIPSSHGHNIIITKK